MEDTKNEYIQRLRRDVRKIWEDKGYISTIKARDKDEL